MLVSIKKVLCFLHQTSVEMCKKIARKIHKNERSKNARNEQVIKTRACGMCGIFEFLNNVGKMPYKTFCDRNEQ